LRDIYHKKWYGTKFKGGGLLYKRGVGVEVQQNPVTIPEYFVETQPAGSNAVGQYRFRVEFRKLWGRLYRSKGAGCEGGPIFKSGGCRGSGVSTARICNISYDSYTGNTSRQYRRDNNGESI